LPELRTYPNSFSGLILAFCIISVFGFVHIYGVFFHSLADPILETAGLIAIQCWLYTGLFIIAHDAMHGSLVPGHARANSILGTMILFFYAGFNWRTMRDAHLDHHRFPGTEKDPDFNAANPRRFWPWYFKFFTHYFGVRQLVILSAITLIYIFLFGASYQNTIVMWAIPAILSSVQLFYFGTYLTHRHGTPFSDLHNARSNDFPGWLSLLTCFHFGYHHEHHLFPEDPWWRLPARKKDRGIL